MVKKEIAGLLAAGILLLAGCAGRALSEPPPVPVPENPAAEPAPAETAAYEKPEYEVVPFTAGNQVRTEDGTVLVVYNYQTVRLALHNEDAVSPQDAAMAARNMETFNAKMASVSEDLMEQGEDLAVNAGANYEVFGAPVEEYEDDAETSAVITGDIISVCMRRFSYTGGAHPNSYVLGWLFDLASGQFVLDPSQLADDPQAFHDSAAELLIEKADSNLPGSRPGEYWDDYQDIIRDSQCGVTLFDEEGMRVLYAPYELGPYAIGEVELRLDWEELAPLLGEECLTRFGVEN